MANFWQLLPKPFLVQAPMDDVTDFVFREIIGQIAKPDVFFTEFTSADGLFSKGHDVVMRKLKYSENQRPIVAQIWGKNPEYLYKASGLVRDLGFDGVDINMGCPDKSIMRSGAGGSLIGNCDLAREIIDSVKNGAGNLSVSVKTRLGYDGVITEDWIGFLLEQNLDAITIHGRTAKQMSKGEANWEEVGKAVKLKNKISPKTILIGNGDILNYCAAKKMFDDFDVDGIMIGRGLFSDPWVFEKTPKVNLHAREEYVGILLEHLRLHNETWGNTKNFAIMKKFFKMYIKDFAGANELRQNLMESTNSMQVEEILLQKLITV